MRTWFTVVALFGLVAPGWSRGDDLPKDLIPFVLPWDDATPTVTDVSGWLHRPAGKFGPIHAGDDGHQPGVAGHDW